MQFQRPKAYDPTLAERGLNSHVTQAVAYQPNHMPRAPNRQDFGFDDAPDSPSGGKAAQLDEKCRDLAQQLEEARAEVVRLKASQEDATSNVDKVEQKIKSIQQVNRSQTTLMKTELQKTRRKLSHREAVCGRLKEQNEWLSQQMPSLALPAQLNGLPTEDEAAEEAKQLLNMHNQWEKDLIQLQADLQGGTSLASKSSTELAESQQRTLELEAETARLKKELDSLRRNGPAGTPGAADDDSALRKEVEVAEEKTKEQVKKLQQLAKAYKKLEQEKVTIDTRLKDAEKALEVARVDAAAKPKAPQRAAISPEVVGRVKTMMSSCRQQVKDLQVSVKEDMKNQFPLLVEESLKALMPELQKMTEAGCKEWKDKYEVECLKRRKLHNLVQELKGNIRVYVRVRPLAAHESGTCMSYPSPDEISIRNEENGIKKTWQFNEVFKENSTQEMLFAGVRDLVVSMIDGYNVCIFAYGQTGAGKTHSMQGTKEQPGIYWRTFCELFQTAKERAGWNIQLKVAIIEVYNDELRDLLADPAEKKPKLQIKQSKEGNHVPGLTMAPVSNPEEVDELLTQGSKNRTTAATDMNLHSSRSHLLVQIHGSMTSPEGKNLSSAITLVDLAGSERLAKSGVEGDRAKEAIAINKSLSALGDVINARATKNGHTPFRNSTLTHLLQDSLSGDSKTLMLMQINPCKDYFDESQCSLQFGARVNAVEMKK